MATLEQRVNIALDSSTLALVKQMAQNAKTSVSKICADLIRRRIEDDEDAYYIQLINEMGDISNKKTVSLEEAKRYLDALPD